jgi:Acetyl-CoA dehydrogenase C-terminal like
MTKASAAALADGTGNADFHRNKLMTARFFADRIMPESNAQRRKIEAGADSIMALPAEVF